MDLLQDVGHSLSKQAFKARDEPCGSLVRAHLSLAGKPSKKRIQFRANLIRQGGAMQLTYFEVTAVEV
jgi:hypothetical protein